MSITFFKRVDFMQYERIQKESNLRKSFPKSLTDDSYYIPSDKGVSTDKTSGKEGVFDFKENTENQKFDWRLAKIRKPGLDVTETKEIVDAIIKDSKFVIDSEIDKSNKAAAEKQAKSDEALKSVIQNTIKENSVTTDEN